MVNSKQMVVCFDLGGVLARIRRSWQSCASAASVEIGLPSDASHELTHFHLFDEFQNGGLESKEYLAKLGEFLSVSSPNALLVHNAILDSPYPETPQLVKDLSSAGFRTACLSNTNSLHWSIMNSPTFSAIAGLDLKMVSHEVRLSKPDEKIFALFDQHARVSPSQVIYFDDNEDNVIIANKHGWQASLIDHEGNTAAQMRAVLKEKGLL